MNKPRDRWPGGFTLIELLIVVAIIGILAAIAIPNYLAATIRARVAQVKAEQVALATALETYFLDDATVEGQRYPPARLYCQGAPRQLWTAYHTLPRELLAPIPYLASLPRDPFNPVRHEKLKYVTPGFGYFNDLGTIAGIQVQPEFPEDRGGTPVYYYSLEDSPVDWALWSVGPGQALSFWDAGLAHHPVPSRLWYDPTNGTLSPGLVVRLSSGQVSP